MTTDQKIEEVLEIVREEREQNKVRFGWVDAHFTRLEARDDELLGLIQEQREILIEERQLNNVRFGQMSAGLDDLRLEVSGVKTEVERMNADLNATIDRVYDSLSQDIQIFAEDLHHVKRRVTRLEKKLPS